MLCNYLGKVREGNISINHVWRLRDDAPVNKLEEIYLLFIFFLDKQKCVWHFGKDSDMIYCMTSSFQPFLVLMG